MTIREEKMDLFEVPQGYYLAYCMTGDLSMGAGVAKKIDKVFNMKAKLLDTFCWYEGDDLEEYVGESLMVDNVFNLVLKKTTFKKAKYKKLRKCLEDMKSQIENNLIKKVAMPKLGCGHEGLEWDEVREIITEVFADTDVEILVCSL